ncbi:FlgB family protein [Parvularcula sp. IMCC14364]|uniref:FlgB family protein n=1 Tax=Parvularcula sp. IMCC14364 TaxID=3067902 RepID=UPI0027420F9C|nr:FlgB family protein [Parvularcula sp. IMCC14364]
MPTDLDILRTYSAMAQHAAKRHEVLAGNIANADTPGYKAQDLKSFAELYKAAERQGRDVEINTSDLVRAASGGVESPNGNNVSIEDQMLKTAETKGQHDMALAVYKKTLDLMRLSLGSNR